MSGCLAILTPILLLLQKHRKVRTVLPVGNQQTAHGMLSVVVGSIINTSNGVTVI